MQLVALKGLGLLALNSVRVRRMLLKHHLSEISASAVDVLSCFQQKESSYLRMVAATLGWCAPALSSALVAIAEVFIIRLVETFVIEHGFLTRMLGL